MLPTVALGEEHLVGWDAVVCHPPVTLKHPDHYVWQAVLGLPEAMREKDRQRKEEIGEKLGEVYQSSIELKN